jgi:hypothetical protein
MKSRGIALAAVLLIGGCAIEEQSGPVDGSQAYASSVSDLELTGNDISGWQNRDGSAANGEVAGFQTYATAGDLAENAINGTIDRYNKDEIAEAAIQFMQSTVESETRKADVYIFDMGTASGAKENMDKAINDGGIVSSTVPLQGAGTAEVHTFSNGCYAFAAYGTFYFELQFSGYSDSDDAVADAQTFLGIYRAKVGM